MCPVQVKLSACRLAPFDFFLETESIVAKSFNIKVNFSEKKVKFAMLIKFYPSP